MARALNLLRSSLHYRRDCFDQGLRKAGFKLVPAIPDPKPGDLLVIWNRYGGWHDNALHFERRAAANPWCALVQTGTDTYDVVGGKA